MHSVTRFLMRRLRLKVNEAKSAVARPETRMFLGFSLSNNKERQNGESRRRPCCVASDGT
jgi:hypothetical protein